MGDGGVTRFEWTKTPRFINFQGFLFWTEMIMLKFFFEKILTTILTAKTINVNFRN